MTTKKAIKGSRIKSLYINPPYQGVGNTRVELTMKDGSRCIISEDEILKALRQCSYKGVMARKYFHLHTEGADNA